MPKDLLLTAIIIGVILDLIFVPIFQDLRVVFYTTFPAILLAYLLKRLLRWLDSWNSN